MDSHAKSSTISRIYRCCCNFFRQNPRRFPWFCFGMCLFPEENQQPVLGGQRFSEEKWQFSLDVKQKHTFYRRKSTKKKIRVGQHLWQELFFWNTQPFNKNNNNNNNSNNKVSISSVPTVLLRQLWKWTLAGSPWQELHSGGEGDDCVLLGGMSSSWSPRPWPRLPTTQLYGDKTARAREEGHEDKHDAPRRQKPPPPQPELFDLSVVEEPGGCGLTASPAWGRRSQSSGTPWSTSSTVCRHVSVSRCSCAADGRAVGGRPLPHGEARERGGQDRGPDPRGCPCQHCWQGGLVALGQGHLLFLTYNEEEEKKGKRKRPKTAAVGGAVLRRLQGVRVAGNCGDSAVAVHRQAGGHPVLGQGGCRARYCATAGLGSDRGVPVPQITVFVEEIPLVRIFVEQIVACQRHRLRGSDSFCARSGADHGIVPQILEDITKVISGSCSWTRLSCQLWCKTCSLVSTCRKLWTSRSCSSWPCWPSLATVDIPQVQFLDGLFMAVPGDAENRWVSAGADLGRGFDVPVWCDRCLVSTCRKLWTFRNCSSRTSWPGGSPWRSTGAVLGRGTLDADSGGASNSVQRRSLWTCCPATETGTHCANCAGWCRRLCLWRGLWLGGGDEGFFSPLSAVRGWVPPGLGVALTLRVSPSCEATGRVHANSFLSAGSCGCGQTHSLTSCPKQQQQ